MRASGGVYYVGKGTGTALGVRWEFREERGVVRNEGNVTLRETSQALQLLNLLETAPKSMALLIMGDVPPRRRSKLLNRERFGGLCTRMNCRAHRASGGAPCKDHRADAIQKVLFLKIASFPAYIMRHLPKMPVCGNGTPAGLC